MGGRSSPTVPRILSPKKGHNASSQQSLVTSNVSSKDIASTSRSLFKEAVQKTESALSSQTPENISANPIVGETREVSTGDTLGTQKSLAATISGRSTSPLPFSSSDSDNSKIIFNFKLFEFHLLC